MSAKKKPQSRKRRRSNVSQESESPLFSPTQNDNHNNTNNKEPSRKRFKQSHSKLQKKYNNSKFTDSSVTNRLKKIRIDKSKTKRSKSVSKSSKSSKKASPKSTKDQNKITLILPRTHKDFAIFKRRLDASLSEDESYQKSLRKFRRLQKRKADKMKTIKQKESNKQENNDSENEESENEIIQKEIETIASEIEKIKQSMLKTENQWQNKHIDKNYSASVAQNSGAYVVYNQIHDQHNWKAGKISTKRLSSAKETILYSMEIYNRIELLRELKEEGVNHQLYVDLKSKWDRLAKLKQRSMLLRNFVLKSTKLIIKILQNENNKYNFVLEKEYKLMKSKMLKIYEPNELQQFLDEAAIEENEITENEIDNKKLFVQMKPFFFENQDWIEQKEDLHRELTQSNDANSNQSSNNDTNDPTPSLSLDPLV